MSRRDTIIIAVLVNAALLMVLFATAMRSGGPKENKIKENKGGVLVEAPSVPSSAEDDILNEYVVALPTLSESTADAPFIFETTELAISPIAPPPPPSDQVVPIPQPSPVSTEASHVNVTVKKGDVLEKIAKANQTTVAAIMKANNMSTTQLKIGQVLKIPVGGKGSSPSSSSTLQEDYYIVKEGDSPWLIASRNKINLEELLRLNGLDEQKAKKLRPGDKLRIR